MIFNKIRCYYRLSDKARMGHGYDYKICFNNFLKNFNPKKEELILILDNCEDSTIDYIKNICNDKNYQYEITFDGNSLGFLNTAKKALVNSKNTILYLLESDYLHRAGSKEALFDIFNNFAENSYVTLYDHPDKYYPYLYNTNINMILRGYCEIDEYKTFKSEIYYLKSGWWRTTPATCCSFACSVDTLNNDINLIEECLSLEKPNDGWLWKQIINKNKKIFSPIPSYSGHTILLPTGVDWRSV